MVFACKKYFNRNKYVKKKNERQSNFFFVWLHEFETGESDSKDKQNRVEKLKKKFFLELL